MKLERATVCLPTKSRQVSHTFYTALGFATVGKELEADGLPEPLQFEISSGLRVMLIPSRGFGWVIGGRKRSPRGAHECLIAIGLATDAAVDALMRRAHDAGATIVSEATNQQWGGRPGRGYAGTFADPDGHMWLVSRADGVLIR
jgi:predicted lactoylglutathione lyase